MTLPVLTMPPDRIAKRHPLWNKEIERLGPWERIHQQVLSPVSWGSAWYPSTEATSTTAKSAPMILICDRYGSSMELAWKLLDQQKIHTWDSVIVTEQTAGRGQFRRNWISPVGNLYASWIWPELSDNNPSNAYQENLLPLVAAYIVAHGLELLGIDVQVKWPNDILCKNRKIGGILVEQRSRKIIVGIGINMACAPYLQVSGTETVMPATCLSKEGFHGSPLKVWGHLVKSGIQCMRRLVRQIQASEFAHLITSRLAWRGRRVHILENENEIYSATLIGIAENGGLVIQKKTQTQIIHFGKILTSN
jgi:BirA family biotin operon repressor/biotin-[acetyl-CoA-carboxylase] ligase